MTLLITLMALGLVRAESSNELELLDRRQLTEFDWPEQHNPNACRDSYGSVDNECIHYCGSS